jgi:NAD(P)-dependent dehydrogenase (short-subunit alcohol dehydrogenase family)
MSTPVLLVLGAGPKIGLSVAKAFADKGYKVALAARSLQDGVGEDEYLHLKIDLANTEEIQKVFTKVKEKLGVPAVVVYNGSSIRVSNSLKVSCTITDIYPRCGTSSARWRRPPFLDLR